MSFDLEDVPIAGQDEAEQRAWRIVARAFSEHEPHTRPRRHGRRALIAITATLGLLVGVAVSPAGSQILHSVREAVGVKKAAPVLTRLPAGGALLVTSGAGPWVVQPDGSKRLLGPYTAASWSPHRLYVAVTRPHELLAVDPHGTVRWSLARRGAVSRPRWSPDGYRIAYLDDASLRIVAGDGTGDRGYATTVAHVAPAWRPSLGHEHVLAFATARGDLALDAVDTNAPIARSRLPASPLQLLWSSDGRRLVALSPHQISVFNSDGNPVRSIRLGRRAVAAAFVPGTHSLTVLLGGARADAVSLDLDRLARPAHEIFSGGGRFSGLAWSPNGHWLLLAWPTANQWLFIRTTPKQRLVAVSAIATQFNPDDKRGSFPTLDGWCCA